MTTTRITERVESPFAGSTVDRAKGVIRNVLVCGVESANGRRYPWLAELRGSVGLYEGRPVNCDHAAAATVDRRIGWLTAPTPGPDGRPRADLHLLTTHPLTARVLEAAERNPRLFGLSHVAMCRTRREGGVEVVEAIESIESVDLVADPATVGGLFESKGKGRSAVVKLKEYLDKLAPRMGLKNVRRVSACKLAEEFGDTPMGPDAPAPDAPDTDSDTAITAAFESAIMAIVKEALASGMDKKSVLKKIGKLIDGHGDAKGDGGTEPDDDDEAEGETYESKKRKAGSTAAIAAAIAESLAVCKKVGFKGFDADDLEAIGAVPAERRETLAKRLMGSGHGDTGEERPTSGGRHQFAEHAGEKAAAKRAEAKGAESAADLPWID